LLKRKNGKSCWMENDIYNPEYVKGLFDRMSPSYERMNYITSFGFSIRWRKQYLTSFDYTKEKVEAIDLLTGMGETWAATKRKLPNSNITALDFSDGMLNYAKTKSKLKFNSEITILKQDVLQNQLPNNHFDFVTCAFGLKTFESKQLEKLAIETKRILKEGGKFSFIEVSKPQNVMLRMFYGFYLGKVIPILGRLFLGNPIEYRMLWQYTVKFENAKQAAKIFRNEGLNVNYKSYFFGCATGFSGQKNN
jgi:ubiquinone/menaquinone biosynthesis methyltransferase